MDTTLEHALAMLAPHTYTVETTGRRVRIDGPLLNTVPVRVAFAQLDGHGNRGGRFSKDLKDAKFVLTCDLQNMDQAYDREVVATLHAAQATWAQRLRDLEHVFFQHVYMHHCPRLKAEALRQAPEDPLSYFVSKGAYRIFKEPRRFHLKRRVVDKATGAVAPVPIFSVDDTTRALNTDDNDVVHVQSGDIVGATLRLNAYVMRHEKFGISLELVDVVRLRRRASTEAAPRRCVMESPRKKRRVTYKV